jgi:hypothetical protein
MTNAPVIFVTNHPIMHFLEHAVYSGFFYRVHSFKPSALRSSPRKVLKHIQYRVSAGYYQDAEIWFRLLLKGPKHEKFVAGIFYTNQSLYEKVN